MDDNIKSYLDAVEKQFKKKNPDSDLEFKMASEEDPVTGLIIDNPQLEYILDRRFLPYGRFYLTYGKKGSSKTSLFYDLAKAVLKQNGVVIWLETENAADITYAAKQGLDISRIKLLHPETLEEALKAAEEYIRMLPKIDPTGKIPVLICLDSIAGSTTEYENDAAHNVQDMMPGSHARTLSRFYREMQRPLSNENCIFLTINQLREKIGVMGYGADAKDSMLGGNAPLFHSTYQMKMSKVSEITQEDTYGNMRKVGSVHKIECKRNKLGREGKGQEIMIDLYIDGGIDWYTPLVTKLKKEYTAIVQAAGGYVKWRIENVKYLTRDEEGKIVEKVIDVNNNYRDFELAQIIASSPEAKEIIRTAFGIPALPSEQEVAVLETKRLSKRKKRKSLDDEPLEGGPKMVPVDE